MLNGVGERKSVTTLARLSAIFRFANRQAKMAGELKPSKESKEGH
jgi:hypothetical protein